LITEAQGPPRGSALNALAFLHHQRDHAREAALLDVGEMVGEALVRADTVFRAAHRPVENHANHSLWMGDAEGDHRAAAHATAHEMRALEIQVIEQAPPLCDVVRPGDALDAAARLPGLAPVENDAAVFFRQVIEELDPRVHTLRFPLVQGRIEARRRVHQ